MITKILLSVVGWMIFQTTVAQKIKGSDSVLPLAQKEAEDFMKKNKGQSVSVTGGGSGVGIAALIDNTVDIASASRKIKFEEKQKIQSAGKTLKEVIIGYDALAVIVNKANKVSQLTRQQLEDIFTGKIRNWKQVGGDNLPIVCYSRETSSGTYDFFKEHILMRKNYMPSILSMPATGAIIQSVSQTKGAVGYVGLAYLNPSTKAIAISYDGIKYVNPSLENAKNKTYPVVRPLFFYYTSNKESLVKPFVNYVLSTEGQHIVKQVGYVPIR